MFSLLPVSSCCCASMSESLVRGSGFKYHLLQIFVMNSVEFLQNFIRKTRFEVLRIESHRIYR